MAVCKQLKYEIRINTYAFRTSHFRFKLAVEGAVVVVVVVVVRLVVIMGVLRLPLSPVCWP